MVATPTLPLPDTLTVGADAAVGAFGTSGLGMKKLTIPHTRPPMATIAAAT
jgi:hypothetical protein